MLIALIELKNHSDMYPDKHIVAKVSECVGEADSTLLDCRVKSKWEL